ncbi:MAG: DUF6155 family protein [Bacteroidales bacterium]|nr:DUF6155 family protein [Bacteroidales bacterium]
MSKATLKKHLQAIEKEDIINLVLDLYTARKEAKDYLEYYLNPDEKGLLAKSKETINKEFFPAKGKRRARVSQCKKVIKHFASLWPTAEHLAELHLYYVDDLVRVACFAGYKWYKMQPKAVVAFRDALQHVQQHCLQVQARDAVDNIMRMALIYNDFFYEEMFDAYITAYDDHGTDPHSLARYLQQKFPRK